MFIKPSDMMKLVTLPGNYKIMSKRPNMMKIIKLPGNFKNHVRKTKFVEINVALFAQF